MSQEAVERFLGRVITDERFRERASKSLEKSCISEGYALSNTEVAYLASMDFKLLGLVGRTLDDSIRRN
jgi:hypothetical protein